MDIFFIVLMFLVGLAAFFLGVAALVVYAVYKSQTP